MPASGVPASSCQPSFDATSGGDAGAPRAVLLNSKRLNLEYRSMDGVGHFLMMEKPGEFNEWLTAFLMKNGLLKK